MKINELWCLFTNERFVKTGLGNAVGNIVQILFTRGASQRLPVV
jgi:hypothetical protein